MKKILPILLFVICLGFPALAQAPGSSVSWTVEARQLEADMYELVFTGKAAEGWHTYGTGSEYSAPYLTVEKLGDCTLEGSLYDISTPEVKDGDPVFGGSFKLGQKVLATGPAPSVGGYLSYIACTDGACTPPQDWEFDLPLSDAPSHSSSIGDPASESSSKGSIWALILEAILWGFAMLLTPCVFPMVPMTVSFFMKGSGSAAAGRFKAFMYGLFIVLLYTVPISVIILITRIVGGDAVTADIFNWLSTHWLPNLIFFVVFMVFAASFFGAFEIVLPSSLVNKSDKNSEKGGLAGIFFMALTLVLVSFSCTGPIVGSVLIRSTSGEFWAPMVTMLAFSVAFALPFTVLALFPSLLKKLKGKSGSWLNSVKVVLGFIEVALGFKFLSVADQTYHWGLLDREVYLAIWIVVFSLLGLYLLGKIKFPHDDPEQKPLGVFRLTLVIAVFSFVVYMIPGMWGAPLKALSGYLPPIETQDFVVWNHADGAAPASQPALRTGAKYDLKMPLGLDGYFTLEEGLEASREQGKPLFVDITGHGCVNCREMESRVWSDPRVLQKLRDEFVIVALYTDDKTKLDKQDWVTMDNGRVLKDLGRVNSYLVRERFGVNAQPNYALLDSDGNLLVPIRGYNLDIDAFLSFLQSGIDTYNSK
ncbi:MAG: thioredoxin family protein [Bacteroidales bacterium]|nr:thioredoxin family protein [Bacteroidales bacterium]